MNPHGKSKPKSTPRANRALREPMSVTRVELFSPAKLNLSLVIMGRRPDGFHDLLSVVSPLAWGDTLTAEREEDGSGYTLTCDDPGVPLGADNLVLKAATAFREATGWAGGVKFALAKRIPMGAGLGGGSSNAAAALRALNRLAGEPLNLLGLTAAAAQVGSDCALFLHDAPVIMRGRGERIESLPEQATARLCGRSVIVFKPAFGIATAWAYGQLVAAAPAGYLPSTEAEARLGRWLDDPASPPERLLFNNMEPPAFAKFPALPVLLERLRKDFGLVARMSGTGSACFALLPENPPGTDLENAIREAWGVSAFIVRTRLVR